jgi:3-oxoacyl-(acyl-carrier-protein) synthase
MTARIAITGGGAVSALGAAPALWRQLRAGARAGGAVEVVPLDELPEAVRARALRAERVTQLVLAAAGRALASAGLATTDGPPRPRLGVVVGTALGCFLTNAEYERRLLEGGPASASPRLFAATVSNAAAGELAIAYRLGGPSVTLSAGAASGTVALGQAVDLVGTGAADAIVAGGADALGEDVTAWRGASGLADERVPSEAAAFAVVETPEHAERRGVRPLGTIAGWAGGFEPDGRPGRGLSDAVDAALEEARMAASEIVLVVGDRAEQALPAAGRRLSLGRHLGDTLAASGPLGLLAALAEAPPGAAVLVVDACPTGHVAALVARVGNRA